MKENVARVKAQELSIKHKEIVIVVIIIASKQYADNKYQIAIKEELIKWPTLYVPIAEYKNGLEWQEN